MAMSEKEILEKIDNPKLQWFDKCMAIKAAGDQKMAKLEEKFLGMLFTEQNFEMCGEIARALVKICGPDDAILRSSFSLMLEDENEATRYGGVIGIGLIDSSAYVGKLLSILDSNNDSRIRAEAARALGYSENAPNKELLLHELERISEKPGATIVLKNALNEAIGKIGKYMASTDKSTRRAFGNGEQAIQQLKQELPNKRT